MLEQIVERSMDFMLERGGFEGKLMMMLLVGVGALDRSVCDIIWLFCLLWTLLSLAIYVTTCQAERELERDERAINKSLARSK